MPMRRWTDRVALITGASSGIGEATSRRLVDEGMRVVGCARRGDHRQHLRQRLGARFHPVACDLTQADEIEALFEEIDTTFGTVDVLINNAGAGHDGGLLEADPLQWRQLLDLNVLAPALCARAALQRMLKASQPGYIINIGSLAGHRVPSPDSGFYSATKHALVGLTEGLRQELRARNADTRVSMVSPGFVETEFAEIAGGAGAAERAYGEYPVLRPEDIANTVVWLLSQPAHVQVQDILLRPLGQPR